MLSNLKQQLEAYPQLNVIIAPHDVSENNMKTLIAFLNGIPYRLYTDGVARVQKRVIIINTVGILADMYKYAHLAYVGGSFKQGIHNVMEPAIYGIPVMYGPVHTNSYEAQSLLENRGALLVKNSTDFDAALQRLMEDESLRLQYGENARRFAMERCGATDKIMNRLEKHLKQ